ncbi:TNF receptor-associated factor 6-like [Corticium candelabrum]|uniref:TNF receptor-associated factor 6-like n=1 Tax=Corticium candelabrum TaxID=121492 RepID=UPI002E25ECD2|nr:TNF receptor-associated factor 6-like [Corticium candelabrum]
MASRVAEAAKGFDAVFVEPVVDRLRCAICLLVLREPVQTDCGHHFCAGCLGMPSSEDCGFFSLMRPYRTHLIRPAISCPLCRRPLPRSKIYSDNALKREILDLMIKCDRHEKGCEWVGQLRYRETHEKECECVKEPCANECGEMVIRKKMKDHKERLCVRRVASCDHCSTRMEWRNLEAHYLTCLQYPVDCIYLCGQTLARSQMEDHTGRNGNCPNSILECDFSDNGCSFKGKRDELLRHIESNTATHLSLIATELKATKLKLRKTEFKLAGTQSRLEDTESRLEEVESQLCEESIRMKYSFPPGRFVHKWRIENCSEKLTQAKLQKPGEMMIGSSSFYVYPGYHLYLQLYPIRSITGTETYIGLYLHATGGIFDKKLVWPFPFSYVLELVDQQSAENNLHRECHPPYTNMIAGGTGYGFGSFCSHEKLLSHHYIKDNSILIKVTINVDVEE